MRHRAVGLLLALAPAPLSGVVVGPQLHAFSVSRPVARLAPPRQSAEGLETFEEQLREFASTAELQTVRGELSRLELKLQTAIDEQDFASAAMARDDIAELRRKDPAVMGTVLRQQLMDAVMEEDYARASDLRDQLLVLRRFLPQYQLAGLWKGNYPNHGDELVRVSYEGDMLHATKVTGDAHVPAGEITFQADLSAPFDEHAAESMEDLAGVRVEVVSLSSDGSQEQREVEQYQGEGRIAAMGFEHAHFVPGQLFLMDTDVLGFLWLPLGTFVVFSRVNEEKECSPAAAAAAAAAFGHSVPAPTPSGAEGDVRLFGEDSI